MRILITGGAGNIGGSLSRELVKSQDFYVDILDDLSTGSKNKLPKENKKNWSFIQANINNHDDFYSKVGDKD